MKSNEKRLLIGFVAALFVVLNFFIFTQVSKLQKRAESKNLQLVNELSIVGDLLDERELWDQRGDWLAREQPVFKTRGEADEDLLATVRATAGKHGITLEDEKLPTPKEHPDYVQSVMRVEGVGDIESILRWVFELQRPTDFRAVTLFRLKPQKDDPAILNCELQVERWYAPGDSAG